MLARIGVLCRLRIKRHLRDPFLWCVLLIAPIAAKYMIPAIDDDYAILAINGAYPTLSSSMIGLALGIVSALLLSPFVYIWLRSSRTNQHPWQIEEITPSHRFVLHIGHWLADTAIVWLVLLVLSGCGIVLSGFRLPFEQLQPFDTLVACLLVACPAFAFLTATKQFFDSRPWLRGALGDITFFFFWLIGISMGAVIAQTDASLTYDLFGYIGPLMLAMDEPIDTVAIIASSSAQQNVLHLDAMQGVLHPEFLLSRLHWLGFAVLLVLFASTVYVPRQDHSQRSAKVTRLFDAVFAQCNRVVSALLSKALGNAPLGVSHGLQMTTYGYTTTLFVGVAFAGLISPSGSAINAVIWLAVIFPFTRHCGTWCQRNIQPFLASLPTPRFRDYVVQYGLFTSVMALMALPAIVRFGLARDYTTITDMGAIIAGVPLAIVLLCAVTHSRFAARVIMLLVWYVYFNQQGY